MTVVEQIELACLMEATARKPGNVHCAASFDDLCYGDFVLAAHAIAEPLAAVRRVGLGRAIFDAIKATRESTGRNVNLGIALLLAPMAAVPEDASLEVGIPMVLERTTVEDAKQVYAAIRLAQPGGMGQAASQDVRDQPTITLREAMSLATDRDRIAEQYFSDFRLVFDARTKLSELFATTNDWEQAIITLHVWMMSQWPDTLIARKCGQSIAAEASARALEVLSSAGTDGILDEGKLTEFDAWLRADGHRRNPGTTADLIAATLFAAVRDGLIVFPSRHEIEQHAKKYAPKTAR